MLILTVIDDGVYGEPGQAMDVNSWETCHLRAKITEDRTELFASSDGQTWQPIRPALNTAKLSDDYGSGLKFTGAMAGICCQDLGGTALPADFDYFELWDQ